MHFKEELCRILGYIAIFSNTSHFKEALCRILGYMSDAALFSDQAGFLSKSSCLLYSYLGTFVMMALGGCERVHYSTVTPPPHPTFHLPSPSHFTDTKILSLYSDTKIPSLCSDTKIPPFTVTLRFPPFTATPRFPFLTETTFMQGMLRTQNPSIYTQHSYVGDEKCNSFLTVIEKQAQFKKKDTKKHIP
jgi:hypothetical protein